MTKIWPKWKMHFKNKYSHLLIMLVLLLFLSPFVSREDIGFPVLPVTILAGILLTLRAIEIKTGAYLGILSMGALAFVSDLSLGSFIANSESRSLLLVGPVLVYAIFLLLAIILLINKMFSVKTVTNDTILGGISVYILLGFLWTCIYIAVYLFDHAAFYLPPKFTEYSMVYFSFITLTTLGYGDIHPLSESAMSLASIEAMAGQMYIAVFISKLVGLHRTPEKNHKTAEKIKENV